MSRRHHQSQMEGHPINKWQAVGIAVEGQPINLGGHNPWKSEWHQLLDEPVELSHPMYPHQHHAMFIYQIECEGQSVIFAAGELSPNVWGFYMPVEQ